MLDFVFRAAPLPHPLFGRRFVGGVSGIHLDFGKWQVENGLQSQEAAIKQSLMQLCNSQKVILN